MGERTMMRLHPEKNPLLGHLPENVMQELLSGAKVEKFKAGDVFIHEGDPSDSIYFVTWGEVAIMKGEFEIDRSRSGSVIGEMGVLTRSPRSASIKACEEVETLKIMADDFNRTLDGHPAILRSLLFEQMGKVTSSHQVRQNQQSAIDQAEGMLSKLVSPQVRDRVLKESNPEELLKGTLDETAILFFDIRGFSSAAEKMLPDQLLQTLNEHIAYIDQAVTENEGIIANYIGDAILAVFNCPVQIADPAAAALKCYLQARQHLNELRERCLVSGDLYFELGAGMNYGEIVSGGIGTEDRFSFTVLGDEVNLAARLEGLTRYYPVEVILSESCVRMLPRDLQQTVMRIDRVQVKGRKNPENIYAICEVSDAERATFDEALDKYLLGRFAEAGLAFAKVGNSIARYMRNRCAELEGEEADWKGHYSWLVK
jgi:class 3 adenylate cyclase